MDTRLIVAFVILVLITVVMSRPQWESANYDCIGSPSLGGFSTLCGFNKKHSKIFQVEVDVQMDRSEIAINCFKLGFDFNV
uniref:Secreted protein n=1 Tax=Ascaris lumbricoides TaxID=6252 RepID=A0A0M3HTW4_ASCLU